MSPPHPPGHILVIGAGLIGTSIGLALRGGPTPVWLDDRDPAALEVAVAMGAGRPWTGAPVDHAVVATPPASVAGVLAQLQGRGVAATYSDVASVKHALARSAEQAGVDLRTWCPAHPVAGRERGGPAAAQAELFRDRAWVLCPGPTTGAAAVAAVSELARRCGGDPVTLTPQRHDEVLATLSHVPQLVASALAVAAAELSPQELGLAGGGFRDGTRVASADPHLWAEIVGGNVAAVGEALDRLLVELAAVRRALGGGAAPAGQAVADLVGRGAQVRRQIPDKAGAAGPGWSTLTVRVDDRPGALAQVFDLAAASEVNVEDVRLEHSATSRRGLAGLAMLPAHAERFLAVLRAAGFAAWTDT